MKFTQEYDIAICGEIRFAQIDVWLDATKFPKTIEQIKAIEKENRCLTVNDWLDLSGNLAIKLSPLYKIEVFIKELEQMIKETEGDTIRIYVEITEQQPRESKETIKPRLSLSKFA